MSDETAIDAQHEIDAQQKPVILSEVSPPSGETQSKDPEAASVTHTANTIQPPQQRLLISPRSY